MKKLKNLYKNISFILSLIFTKTGRQEVLAVYLKNKYENGMILNDKECITILLKDK